MRRFVIALTFLTLVGCATAPTAPPKDKELSRTSDLARAAFEAGATAKAIDLYKEALNRAHAMDDATEIGNAAYNLALCHIILGQLDQASVSLVEAKAAFQRGGSNPADVLLLEATVAQRQGKSEQALSLADQVLSASPDENYLFQVALLKGTIACQQDDPAVRQNRTGRSGQASRRQCRTAGRQGATRRKHLLAGGESGRGRSSVRPGGGFVPEGETLSRHGAHVAACR